MIKIPNNLQGILWSTPIEKLNVDKHKSYIIHQVLMYGDFDQIRWLFKTYSKKQIVDIFLHKPQKVYTKEAFNYVNKFILGLKDRQLPIDKYVSTIS